MGPKTAKDVTAPAMEKRLVGIALEGIHQPRLPVIPNAGMPTWSALKHAMTALRTPKAATRPALGTILAGTAKADPLLMSQFALPFVEMDSE